LLASYPFPGNIPELRQLVHAALRQSPVGRLSLAPFQHYFAGQDAAAGAGGKAEVPLLLAPGPLPTLAEARGLLIREALQRANGNQSIAARLLGISQPALSIHLKKSGLLPPSR
jgi:DNA-binding NtrC family response regulator